jgi:hypothetical protein
VSAKDLVGLPGVELVNKGKKVTYFHLLCDHHEVIFAEGAATESMLTGDQALYALDTHALMEIALIFPATLRTAREPARTIVRGEDLRQLKRRHVVEHVPLLAA